jgi:hypothetical protein
MLNKTGGVGRHGPLRIVFLDIVAEVVVELE